jgi:NAD(P)-dependent dehydrogenase (short-subunit alcohol dehydrogenase family)
MTDTFDGKALLVTGAAGGIGSAIVRLAAERGARVLVADVKQEDAAHVADGVGGEAVAYQVDVSDPDACQAMVDTAVSAFGRLDGAINAHGVIAPEHTVIGDTPLAEWRRVLTINLDGVFYCMRAELPAILASGGGAVVNFASSAGLVAHPNACHYVASKHGVVGLTRAAALEYAPRGVRVNAVAPGTIITPMTERVRSTPGFLANQPSGRPGNPEEVAELALFLASDASTFCVGGVYTADGGYTAR